MVQPIKSDTCINCRHAREISTFKECKDCFANQTPGNAFPNWKPIAAPDPTGPETIQEVSSNGRIE